MNIWTFLQDQVLGMKWLNELIGHGLSLLGLDLNSRIGGSIQFSLYDTIKIMVLLGFLILLISYIQSYFPPERTKKILGRFHGIGANCIAALLGTVERPRKGRLVWFYLISFITIGFLVIQSEFGTLLLLLMVFMTYLFLFVPDLRVFGITAISMGVFVKPS